MIIGISGKIGSGKDTLCGFIQEYAPSFENKKFAAKLKLTASLLSGAPVENFESQKFKDSQMDSEWGMTYREFLQKLGTDAVRNNVHTNAWVNALFADYKPRKGRMPNWIITDVRFPNEANAILDRGGEVVRINRPVEKNMFSQHPSETALDNFEGFSTVIQNTGTLDKLRTAAMNLLQNFYHEAIVVKPKQLVLFP